MKTPIESKGKVITVKLIGKNTVIYAIGNVCFRFASFLLIPLYTHTLSMNEYGLLVTLLMTIQIMIVIMGLGNRSAFIRFASEYERKNLMRDLLGSCILINMAGGAIVTSISVLFLLPFFRRILHTDHVIQYIALACFVAMAQSLSIHILSYYRARNEGLKFMLGSGTAALLLIITNFVFLMILRKGVIGALIAQIISFGAIWVVVFFKVISKTGIGVSKQLIGKLVKFGFPLVFAMSGDYITDLSAFFLLSYFGSLEQVAIYSLGYKIAQISIMVLILPFHLAYEPFVYANITAQGIRTTISKLMTYLMLCFVFVAFGITFVSRGLLPLIGPPEYSSAYPVIFLMLPAIAFRGMYYVGESLLHIKNKTYVTATTVSVLTMLSVILNYLLIPQFGMYGAIFVFSFTIISIAVLLMILGVKVFPIPLEFKRLTIAFALLLSFLFLVFFLSKTNVYVYYSILPIVACACIVFLYFWDFFDDKEKSAIKGIIWKIKGIVKPPIFLIKN